MRIIQNRFCVDSITKTRPQVKSDVTKTQSKWCKNDSGNADFFSLMLQHMTTFGMYFHSLIFPCIFLIFSCIGLIFSGIFLFFPDF